MATPAEALALGLAHHRAGRLPEAEAVYRQILQADPLHPGAMHLLGVIAQQCGQLERAVQIIGQAVQLNPGQPIFLVSLGEANRCLGRNAEAIACFQRALQLRPDNALAHNNLGLVFADQGKWGEAEGCYRRALQLRPALAEAHINLGNALKARSQLALALASYRAALALEPANALALSNLGLALVASGALTDAVTCFEQALHLRPDLIDVYINLSSALQNLGRNADAIRSYETALRLRPDHALTLSNLGNALDQEGRLDEALACHQRALELAPHLAEAHNNLAETLKNLGRIDDALAAYRTALRLQPEAAAIHSNLILALSYHPAYDARAIQEECARWNQLHAEPLRNHLRPHANPPDPERRLRIGYLSTDFREHVDAHFLIPLLSHHDHQQFEIFCFANVRCPDRVTERMRGLVEGWRSLVGLSDEQASDLIRGEQIDVLIDLELHLCPEHLRVLARKPAPVQVTWLGYPGTTGLGAIDYRLTDPYLDPPGLFDAFYAEESVRLPETFWCYDPLAEQPSVNPLPALQAGQVTFGCLNNFCKVNDECLALWGQVLRTAPGSRLLLLAPKGQARERVLAGLRQQGVAPDRLEFAYKRPRSGYLQLYHHIDCCLDPLPYNGHTTSLDALWMGVPLITLVSRKTAFGRAGWSLLCNLGLPELAAQTPGDYVARAAELAADLPRLQELRGTLRERLRRSPLMDARRFAAHMEQAYRQMWRRWCHGK